MAPSYQRIRPADMLRPNANSLTSHPPAPTRLHGFDALRALAMLLVILLHAAVPYIVQPMPGLLWPTFDAMPSAGIEVLFWWIECFVMALFFVISGYFAAQLFQKKGARQFLLNRCKRVLMPLLAATLVILPLMGYVWVLGWVLDGKCPPVKLRSFKFDEATEQQFRGLAHLWYLQYLFCYCLAFGAISRLKIKRSPNPRDSNYAAAPKSGSAVWGPILIVVAPIACAGTLWFDPNIVLGFQQSIVPVATRLVYYAIFFTFGAVLFSRQNWLAGIQRYCVPMLILSLIVFALLRPLVQRHLGSGSSGGFRLAMVVLVSLFAWLTTCGLLGFFTRTFVRQRSAVTYLADASYWLYLTHPPIVAACHIALGLTGWHVWTKLAISFLVALGVTLLGYQLLVRHKKLGSWLGGSPRSGVALRSNVARDWHVHQQRAVSNL